MSSLYLTPILYVIYTGLRVGERAVHLLKVLAYDCSFMGILDFSIACCIMTLIIYIKYEIPAWTVILIFFLW